MGFGKLNSKSRVCRLLEKGMVIIGGRLEGEV